MVQDDAWIQIEGIRYSDPDFATAFDAARPQAPGALMEILAQLIGARRPSMVVDLGCGTGLSTRPWAQHADSVLGIEPSDEMRRVAESHPGTPANVHYRAGISHQTGLADHSVDIVTCCRALHWMDPKATFAEVARILRPGGVFAAYDYEDMPATYWLADQALQQFDQAARRLALTEEVPEAARQRWTPEGHLQRLRDSGHFRYVKQLSFHNREMGDTRRLVELCRSFGGVHQLLSQGNPEIKALLETLRAGLAQAIGDRPVALYFSYQMWLGVR